MGGYRDVSRETVLYDSGICDGRGVSIGDYGFTYALRQSEVLAEGDPTATMEADRIGIMCGILFDFRDDNGLSKGACALYFSDFLVVTSYQFSVKEASD